MTRRTLHSFSRRFRVIEDTNDKGEVIDSHLQKRTVILDAVPREKWTCECGKEYMVAIGQTIKCKHDGLTRKERRALKRKFGKHHTHSSKLKDL